MTPKQKIALAARQAGEHGAMMKAWLEQNGHRLGASESCLGATFGEYAAVSDRVQQALERPPAVGLIAASGTGASWLAGAIMTPTDHRAADAGARARLDGVRNFLAGENQRNRAAAVRFAPSEPAANPGGYPFATSLLGLADLAAILFRAYYLGTAGAHAVGNDRARVAAVYDEVGATLAPATVPGLTQRDVMALRDLLLSLYPEASGLRSLTAAGYWEDLAEVSSHLQMPARVRVLSLLWGEQASCTWLFSLLGEALSQLGYGTDVYCPREAFLSADPASGWAVQHNRSVIDAAALARLGDESDDRLQVVGRYGHRAALARSTLAGLVAEVVVPTGGAVMASSPATELMVFPARPPLDDEVSLSPPGRPAADSARERADIAALYAHAKAAHLIDRARIRHDLTALVAVVDPAEETDDALSFAVGDWIDQTHGATPEAREHSRTRLVVVASRADPSRQPFRRTSQMVASRWAERLEAAVARMVGGGLDWPSEWLPGRRFSNIYLFRHPDGPPMPGSVVPSSSDPAMRRSTGAEMVKALLSLADRPRHYVRPNDSIERAFAAGDGGAGMIIDALRSSAQPADKHFLLRRELVRQGRGVRARLKRLKVGVDPMEDADWRQRVGIVVCHRVERVAESGRLGLLLQALSVEDGEMRALAWRRWSRAADASSDYGSPVPPVAPPGEADGGAVAVSFPRVDARRANALAALAMAYWEGVMRRSARSGRLAREIGLPGPAFEHLVDEIAAGARRLGLERRLVQALESVMAETHSERRDELFASCAGSIINAYIEHLDIIAVLPPRSRLQAPRDTSMAGGASATPPPLPPAFQHAAGAARPLAVSWCESLARLIEANVSAHRLEPATSTDPDLARLAAGLPADNEEADF